MRVTIPNLRSLGRHFVALKAVRWRHPLVQVWGLIGVVLVAGIVAHYAWRPGGGEQKNESWALALLKDGGQTDDWRPEIILSGDGAVTTAAQPAALDLRACADAAAERKDWRFLPIRVRQAIAALREPVRTVTVNWSGTRGGDAEALDLYFKSVKEHPDEMPRHFVIGNGLRSRDGEVETCSSWLEAGEQAAEIRICLVGEGKEPTPAQLGALGELITSIEARSGRVVLAVHQPAAPALLAYAD